MCRRMRYRSPGVERHQACSQEVWLSKGTLGALLVAKLAQHPKEAHLCNRRTLHAIVSALDSATRKARRTGAWSPKRSLSRTPSGRAHVRKRLWRDQLWLRYLTSLNGQLTACQSSMVSCNTGSGSARLAVTQDRTSVMSGSARAG